MSVEKLFSRKLVPERLGTASLKDLEREGTRITLRGLP